MRVTVVDRADHRLFQPLLYQVAAAALLAPALAAPMRRILARRKNTAVILAEAERVAPAPRVVVLDGSETLAYDRPRQRPARRLRSTSSRCAPASRCSRGGSPASPNFSGTDPFGRFVWPSRVPQGVPARMRELAERLLRGTGHRHRFFNIEIVWNPTSDRLTPIEITPRLASRLAGLYRRADGIDPYRLLLELCTGCAPRLARRPTACAIAASPVSRRFDGRPLEAQPGRAEVASVRGRIPDAAVMLHAKRGQALARNEVARRLPPRRGQTRRAERGSARPQRREIRRMPHLSGETAH